MKGQLGGMTRDMTVYMTRWMSIYSGRKKNKHNNELKLENKRTWVVKKRRIMECARPKGSIAQ